MTLFSSLSGPIRDGDEAIIPATDSAVTHGDGVFETILVTGGTPLDLAPHQARLRLSAGILDIETPPDEAWHPAINALIGAWGERDFVLRLTVTRSGTVFATAAAVPETTLAARAGISVILAADPFNRRAPYLTTVAKSLSYATNMAALRYAKSRGADDVIFLADDGTISESPTATVVLATRGQFITPPPGPETGNLPSITVARLDPTYRRITAQDLYAADAIYLLSAIRLAAPVISLDGTPRPQDCALTESIMQSLLSVQSLLSLPDGDTDDSRS
ncbi:MAG: aminotransferase class IV [Nakamurella sp.]